MKQEKLYFSAPGPAAPWTTDNACLLLLVFIFGFKMLGLVNFVTLWCQIVRLNFSQIFNNNIFGGYLLQMRYCDAIPVVEKLVEDVAGSDNGSVTDGSDICWHSGYVWHPMAPNPFTICILFTNTDHLPAPDFFLFF